MHLNEFTDAKIYALPAKAMATLLKQLERIWRDHGLEAEGPFICGLRKQPEGRRRALMGERRDWTKRQSHRRQLLNH